MEREIISITNSKFESPHSFECSIECLSNEKVDNEFEICIKGEIFIKLEIGKTFTIGFPGSESITSRLKVEGRIHTFRVCIPYPDNFFSISEVTLSVFTIEGRLISREVNLPFENTLIDETVIQNSQEPP